MPDQTVPSHHRLIRLRASHSSTAAELEEVRRLDRESQRRHREKIKEQQWNRTKLSSPRPSCI